ncbi:MAG: hypothetical protein IPP74_13490 [Alphaproteobacteria bacterium]|nr:hypothetical protein [Alphaproteobacteria bacterium]
MPSQTEIVNMALTHLGQESVASIDSDSDNAIKSKLIWDGCRDEVLRACPWSFSTVIAALNEYSDDTVTGWDYVYAYPPKCLFIRKIYSDYNQNIIDLTSNMSQLPNLYLDESFKVVFNPTRNLKVLVCNISPAYAEYTYQVTDPGVWDSLFVKAMSFKLASELANYLEGSQESAKRNFELYRLAISEAMATSQNESNIPRVKKSAYIDAR